MFTIALDSNRRFAKRSPERSKLESNWFLTKKTTTDLAKCKHLDERDGEKVSGVGGGVFRKMEKI